MRKALLVFVAAVALVVSSAMGRAQGQKTLDMYFLDMEGGGGTLMVSPSGESLLLDVGVPGARDAGRVVALAKDLGLTQIDYFLATHFHGDHYGGLADLVARFPVRTFIDHGLTNNATKESGAPHWQGYTEARAKVQHIVVKPGDKLPLMGLDVTVVTARGQKIKTPLAGGGAPNPLCADDFTPRYREGDLGDQMSIGLVIQYGNFREFQAGDLTWNREQFLLEAP